jgi:hypothetical protein
MTPTVICDVDRSPRSSTVVEAAATRADGLVLAHSRQAPSPPLGRAAPHPGDADEMGGGSHGGAMGSGPPWRGDPHGQGARALAAQPVTKGHRMDIHGTAVHGPRPYGLVGVAPT